jgi:hypothetical protein
VLSFSIKSRLKLYLYRVVLQPRKDRISFIRYITAFLATSARSSIYGLRGQGVDGEEVV